MKSVRVKICKLCKQMFWHNKKIKPGKVMDFDVVVEEVVCKDCEPKPFRALVQLRGFSEPVFGDFKNSLKLWKKVKGGFDLQFSTARSSNAYYKWLKKKMPDLKVKRTRSHVSTKGGEKIYRPTICFRKI
ncbi:MAG: hypothetical protein GON13_02960 [Nanoarchaeota archaeon]|nr:hypothetical protein [Nanoarchaeota archaeon]